MPNSFNEAIGTKVVSYLKSNFPGKKLICDPRLKQDEADIWGFNSIPVYVVEKGKEVYFRTNIIRINQYLS